LPTLAIAGKATIVGVAGRSVEGSAVIVSPPSGAFDPGIFDPGIFGGDSLRPFEAAGSAEVDGSTSDAARPRDGARQECGMEVAVGGAFVSLSELLFIETDRALDRPIQTFGFGMPLPASAARFGSPYDRVGPGMGKQPVDVYGTYRTATGTHRFPLIKRGLVDNSRRRAGAAGYTEEFNGGDEMARWDRRSVTYVAPAGHGLYRGRIVQAILALAGETRFQLEPGRQMFKEVQLVDGNPIDFPQELLETEGRALLKNRVGFVINPQLGIRKPLTFHLEERDLLLVADVETTHPGDVVTDVTLTGTQQIVRDDNEQCGIESKPPREVIVEGMYSPWQASYVQGGDCALTGLAPPTIAPTRQQLTRTRTILVYRCGVLLTEITEVYGWRREEAARYVWAGGGVRNCRAGVYLSAGAAANDSEPAYTWKFERPDVLLTRAVVNHYYNSPNFGFTGEHNVTDPEAKLVAQGGLFVDGVELSPPPRRGFRLGSIREDFAFYQIRRALKTAVPGVSWEEVDPDTGVLTTGSGEGVSEAAEVFRKVGRQVEVIDSTDDGYVKSEVTFQHAYVRRPGTAYQYAGGDTFAEAQESFDLSGWNETVYLADQGEAGHTAVSASFTWNGSGPVWAGGRTESRDGAPPAVERIQPEGPQAFDPALFGTPEEVEAARNARPTESQQIKVTLSVPSLYATHEPREVKTSLPWAETVEELAEAALHIVRQSCAHGAVFATAANFQIQEGDWGHVKCRANGMGLDHDVEVWGGKYAAGVFPTPCVSLFVGKVYPPLAA
jgi:hypothetical protein